MQTHCLSDAEIQKYYQNVAKRSSKNKAKFNDVFSRDNLPNKIKDGAYIINFDEYSDIGTHWVALYVKNIDEYSDIGTHWVALYVEDNNVTYFDSFGVEHIPKEIKAFINSKNIKTNIFRIQAYNSIMCGYICIGFIDFMLAILLICFLLMILKIMTI